MAWQFVTRGPPRVQSVAFPAACFLWPFGDLFRSWRRMQAVACLKAEPIMFFQDERRVRVQKDDIRATAFAPRAGHRRRHLHFVIVVTVVGVGFADDLPHENHEAHGNDDAEGNEDDG